MEKELVVVGPQVVTQVESIMLAEWKKKDKKAQKDICLRISSEYLVYIDQSTTTPELWTRLKGIFESKVAIGIVNLHHEFFWAYSEDAINMEEHVCKLCRVYVRDLPDVTIAWY